MKLISDNDRRIGWNEVFDVLCGIMLVFSRCLKRKVDSPAWLYAVAAVLAFTIGVCELAAYRHNRKKGLRGTFNIFFGVLFVLWGIAYVLEVFSLLL